MNKDLMIAYAEVDTVINLMEDRYIKKIPEKLRQLISKNRLDSYKLEINPDIPLKEQKISKKGLAILAVLNYNYWCDETKKKELLKLYLDNEKKQQRELHEIYNLDKVFHRKNEQLIENNRDNDTKQLIKYSKINRFIFRLINKIKNIF